MDEKTFWEALDETNLRCTDWIIRKEYSGEKQLLHLYGEFKGDLTDREIARTLDQSLTAKDPFYNDLQRMLDIFPLQVTCLSEGAFERYYDIQRDRGLPLTERRPPRMNAPDSSIEDLLRTSAAEVR
jgi:hypothetical protein